MLHHWQAGSPQIEEDGERLYVTVHDVDVGEENDYRRNATQEETQQAILYWIADIHNRIGKP